MTSAGEKRIDPVTGKIIELGSCGYSFCRSVQLDSVLEDGDGKDDTDSSEQCKKVNKWSINTCQDDGKGRNALLVVTPSVSKRKICMPVTESSSKQRITEGNSGDSEQVASNSNLTEWKNPVLGVSGNAGLDVRLRSINEARLKRFLKISNTFSFEKGMLDKVQVLGQVDNKFIACVTQLQRKASHKVFKDEASEARESHLSKVLILFDQHAVHERIRLERLQYQFLTGIDQGLAEKRTETKRDRKIPSSLLNPVLKIEKPTYQFTNFKQLSHHIEDFQKIGILLNVHFNSPEKVTVVVRSLPRLFVKAKHEKPLEKKPLIDTEIVFDIIDTHLNFLINQSSFCPRIPPAIGKVLNSLACHGAIRFGDPLNKSEISSMLTQLKRCDLPFQCAHGRPSAVPLCNLTLLEETTKARDVRPHLRKLLDHDKES